MIRLALLVLVTLALVRTTPVEGEASHLKSVATEKATPVVVAQVVEPPKPPEPAPPPKVEVQPPVDGCGDNEYAHFIYMKESGCRTTAVNSIGCRGIGQACPGSKLPCGDDYACQNAWFTNYALERYGSWANAHAFWLNNHWW